MNLPPYVMKIDCVIGKKYALDTNIITRVGGGVHNFTFMVHIDQQYSRFSVKKMKYKPMSLYYNFKEKNNSANRKKIIIEMRKDW
jgi:hypothetical protein